MKILPIFLILLITINSASAGKVWVDDTLVYDSDAPPSIFDQIKSLLGINKLFSGTVTGGTTYQTYLYVTRAFFGRGDADCAGAGNCWTAEMYQPNFPTYWNKYPLQSATGSGNFYAQFKKSDGSESGQVTSTSEQALFDYFDSVGIDYSKFYTRSKQTQIITTPAGASISINNAPAVDSPYTFTITKGISYILSISKTGYDTQFIILTYETAPSVLNIALMLTPTQIQIISNPAYADVVEMITNTPVYQGATPMTIIINDSLTHKYQISKPGFNSKSMEISRSSPSTISVSLEPISVPTQTPTPIATSQPTSPVPQPTYITPVPTIPYPTPTVTPYIPQPTYTTSPDTSVTETYSYLGIGIISLIVLYLIFSQINKRGK